MKLLYFSILTYLLIIYYIKHKHRSHYCLEEGSYAISSRLYILMLPTPERFKTNGNKYYDKGSWTQVIQIVFSDTSGILKLCNFLTKKWLLFHLQDTSWKQSHECLWAFLTSRKPGGDFAEFQIQERSIGCIKKESLYNIISSRKRDVHTS